MADSSAPLDSEGHLLLSATALNVGGLGASYNLFTGGDSFSGWRIDDYLLSDNDSSFEGGFHSTFINVHQTGADSDFNFYRNGGSRSFGQGLIMALDSDAQNATGDGGGTGGLTQYWIG